MVAAAKIPAKENAAKEKARKLLLSGSSHGMAAAKLGEGAEEAIRAAVAEIVVPAAEDATKINVERLAYLASKLMPKAEKGDEVAINAVVKILQVQQRMVLDFDAAYRESGEGAEIDAFRKNKDGRRRKNSSAHRS